MPSSLLQVVNNLGQAVRTQLVEGLLADLPQKFPSKISYIQ
jgi:hypothetical protein